MQAVLVLLEALLSLIFVAVVFLRKRIAGRSLKTFIALEVLSFGGPCNQGAEGVDVGMIESVGVLEKLRRLRMEYAVCVR